MANESISEARQWIGTLGAIASIITAVILFFGIVNKMDDVVLLQTDTKRMVDDISADRALDLSSPGSAWKRLAWKGINDSNHRGYVEPAGELQYVTAERWKGAKSLIPESKRQEIDEILAKIDEIDEKPIEHLMSIVVAQLGGSSWLSCINDPEVDYLPTHVSLGIIGGYIEEKRHLPE